ncbi:MAG: serine hydrolase domain-containing protein [Candidatus Limnocylindrales bacterium]
MIAPGIDAARLQPAFDLVAGQVAGGLVPSAVLAVGRGSGMVRVEAYSGSDRVTTDSIYLLASISKSIVATAVMQLVERGLLDLSTPLRQYLTAFRAPAAAEGLPGGEAVTARHLLTHTSGMMEMEQDLLVRERPSAARLLEIACTSPLRFAPGTRYQYSSLSWAVLGELIHRLDGRDHPAYLRDQIFGPLDMADAGYAPADKERAVALHFEHIPRPLQSIATSFFISMTAPGGGLWSTAGDLVNFGRAMLGGGSLGDARILGRRFVEQMTSDQTAGLLDSATPRAPAHYGLGWSLPGLDGHLPGSAHAFGHGGLTGTRLLVDPDADLVVVYLANRWGIGDGPSWAAIHAVHDALGDPREGAS